MTYASPYFSVSGWLSLDPLILHGSLFSPAIPNPVKLSRIADSTYLGDHSLSLSLFLSHVYAILFDPWINPSWLIAVVAFEGSKLFFFSLLVFLSLVIDLARCVRVKFGKEFELPVR